MVIGCVKGDKSVKEVTGYEFGDYLKGWAGV